VFGRPRCRWKYNIKMGLAEIGFGSMDWVYQDQYRSSCEHGSEPSGSIKDHVVQFSSSTVSV
jgi:hypothetical protein